MATRRAKQAILKWCQESLKDYEGVQVTNFKSDLLDGLAFCALIHKNFTDDIDGVDFGTLKNDFTREERLQWAFDSTNNYYIY